MMNDVSLAAHTTLCVGGPARHWCDAVDVDAALAALHWAEERGLKVTILGGGSNVLCADRGVDGLVLRIRDDSLKAQRDGDIVLVDVGAGMSWDAFVAWAVDHDYDGVTCLSGIPGDVGAAPMQNVGAYGEEVSQTIVSVEAIDRTTSEVVTLTNEQCGFGYRDSMLKRDERHLVTRVRFRLHRGRAPVIAYAELERAVGSASPSLSQLRETVIALRRGKSMVLDPSDENRRSAGSFFVNPTMTSAEADAVAARSAAPMPRFASGDRVKVPAAWLIEQSGFVKGTRRGNVGISTRHSLSIVNLGHASAAELVAFASEIRASVRDRFGVTLHPEPRPVGFFPEEISALYA